MGTPNVLPQLGYIDKTMSPASCAYSPGHITGFFHTHYERSVSKTGSTGAGICLERGVVSRVFIKRARRSRVTVTFNGRRLRSPIVSKFVARAYLARMRRTFDVHVANESSLPIGTGYGTSGAAALSLSLAINDALGGPLGKSEEALIAHKADVRSKTGLGTVASVFTGGFTVRTRAGAPMVGRVIRIPFSKTDRVVSASFGPIPTSRVLSQQNLRVRVDKCSKGFLRRLLETPRIPTFLSLSRRFSDCLGLMTPRLQTFLVYTKSKSQTFSMMMIGEAAFTIAREDELGPLRQLFKKVGLVPLTAPISSRGARLI